MGRLTDAGRPPVAQGRPDLAPYPSPKSFDLKGDRISTEPRTLRYRDVGLFVRSKDSVGDAGSAEGSVSPLDPCERRVDSRRRVERPSLRIESLMRLDFRVRLWLRKAVTALWGYTRKLHMVRFARMLLATGAVSLAVVQTARAGSDITLAAIATGRLYVVGTTERPNTPVVLDGQFRTESNDKSLFQYELLYHPSRCIVSAVIDGKTYEAVVSNCGEVCRPESAGASGAAFIPLPPAGLQSVPAAGPPRQQPSSKGSPPIESFGTAPLMPPTAPRSQSLDARPSAKRDPGRTGARENKSVSVVRPSLPPARPSPRVKTRARPAQPDSDVESPGGEP